MTINQSGKDGGQKPGEHIPQELHHRHHLLSEGCPTGKLRYSFLTFKAAYSRSIRLWAK